MPQAGDGARALKQEAAAAGANAVVDVKMRKIRLGARRQHGFHPARHRRAHRRAAAPAPIRSSRPCRRSSSCACSKPASCRSASRSAPSTTGLDRPSSTCSRLSGRRHDGAGHERMPLTELGQFWEGVRRYALRRTRRRCAPPGQRRARAHPFRPAPQGRGRRQNPPRYLGRHIVIGTVVDTRRRAQPCRTPSARSSTCATTSRRCRTPRRRSTTPIPFSEEEGAI